MDNNFFSFLKIGSIAWYDFSPLSKILCVSDDVFFLEFFQEKNLTCDLRSFNDFSAETFLSSHVAYYDYIVAIKIIETTKEPVSVLENFKKLLKPSGHLLLGVENRLGIKYFCGEVEPGTNRLFQGIENYRNVSADSLRLLSKRLYSKNEIDEFLAASGFSQKKYYSVFPDLDNAQLVYAEDYLPNEDISMRIVPQYNSKETIFLDEQHLYTDLIANKMFHQHANSYFIDCSVSNIDDTLSVTMSLDRKEENQFITKIYANKIVEKIACNEKSYANLKRLHVNLNSMREQGLKVVDTILSENSLSMPYIEAPLAVNYLRSLLLSDINKFIEEMDNFRNLILNSSKHIENPSAIYQDYEDSDGVILENAFVDMVPINAFHTDEGFVFVDQEFVVQNYPANAIIFRMVAFVYDQDINRENILNEKFFMDRYGLSDNLQKWIDLSLDFVYEIKNTSIFENSKTRAITKVRLIDNQNAVFKIADFENAEKSLKRFLVEKCFDDLNDGNVIVYGTGKFANKFYAFYKDELNIVDVIDSNPQKAGTFFHDLCIHSPSVLEMYDKRNIRIIICIKDFLSVYYYLLNLGFENVRVYDVNFLYSGRQSIIPKSVENVKKKYHIGYIAGVFDLFHIGHLNMFRRAKKQCDYLIAAVVSDRGVREGKKREPFIPFEERIEMVRSCRYVDEAVEIPFDYPDTWDAFRKYHFDVQFSGSDYEHDEYWLKKKQFLEENGSTMVFFPYTEQTSSTKIKALIEKGLM